MMRGGGGGGGGGGFARGQMMTPVCCPAAQPAKAQRITDTLENRIGVFAYRSEGGAFGAPHSEGSWEA